MEENSIIFLDLDDIHLLSAVQLDDSRIAYLSPAFRIERRSVEDEYPLPLHVKVLEKLHLI